MGFYCSSLSISSYPVYFSRSPSIYPSIRPRLSLYLSLSRSFVYLSSSSARVGCSRFYLSLSHTLTLSLSLSLLTLFLSCAFPSSLGLIAWHRIASLFFYFRSIYPSSTSTFTCRPSPVMSLLLSACLFSRSPSFSILSCVTSTLCFFFLLYACRFFLRFPLDFLCYCTFRCVFLGNLFAYSNTCTCGWER